MLPLLPENAPFNADQRAWLNGFLAGIFNDRLTAETEPRPGIPTAAPNRPLLILFGSQTGSAEALSRKLAKEADKRGFTSRLLAWNDYAQADLSNASLLVVVTSTWGDGDAPDNAAAGLAWLLSDQAPRLSQLSYAVLGLGDRNYSEFCGAAKKFDQRLSALGGKRLIPTGECDADYETAASSWLSQLWSALETASPGRPVVTEANGATTLAVHEPPNSGGEKPQGFSRQNPLHTRMKCNRRLNHASSSKDTRHIEILLDPSELAYEAGDALGVLPTNCPVLVEEFMAVAGLRGDELVQIEGAGPMTLHEALLRSLNITQPTREFLEHVSRLPGNAELARLLGPDRRSEFDAWLYGRDLVDVLRGIEPSGWDPQDLVSMLRRLQPRLYSISSSPKAHPGEVHVTVGTVRYEAHGRHKKGVASCWLADRVIPEQTDVPVFIQKSHGFRLPDAGDTPVIMVGPGTGIAPFRSFLEERASVGATGRNWLFFGDQRRAQDFLYEEQILAWRDQGILGRLDLAFSRDQKEKVYVQHRMLEAAEELWRWLDSGAHFYVCGDAKRMAKDVDEALHRVVQQAGGRSEDAARDYVAAMKTGKRYQRDVY